MKLYELLDEATVYAQVEREIRDWIANEYHGVYDIEFHNRPAYDENGKRLPDCEIVQCVPVVRQTLETAQAVVSAVNDKIDEILSAHDEAIYLSERLTRIYKRHPKFKYVEINSISELKRNRLFLKYLDELIIRPKKDKGDRHGRTN